MTINDVKPFHTDEQLVDLLSTRGMHLDRDVAIQWLHSVGYYRLSGYWYSCRETNPDGSRSELFVPDTNFADVVRLYEFDRKLRTLIHDGIERVEVALRARISDHLGAKGPLVYRSPDAFRPAFDHVNWLETVSVRATRARRRSLPVRHHETKYQGFLPIWVLMEVLDFADVSRMYDGLPAADQWAVAQELGVSIDVAALSVNQRRKVLRFHPLARWFEQLTVLRNTCAHHSRVWNRSFTPASTVALRPNAGFGSLPKGQSERLYGALLVIATLVRTASPGSSWPLQMSRLVEESLESIPGRSAREMGFPELWREEALWSRRPSPPTFELGQSSASLDHAMTLSGELEDEELLRKWRAGR